MRRIVCFAVVMLCISGPAGAETPKVRALALFAQSDIAYKNGNFERAVSLLRRAYELHQEPLLQYNLARALEGMNDPVGAIEAYEKYLASGATIDDRGAIERRLKSLKDAEARKQDDLVQKIGDEEKARALAAERAASESKPTPLVVAPRPRAQPSSLPWITIGIGSVALATGGVFGFLATKASDDAAAAPGQLDARDLHASAERQARTANVLFIAGGALVAGGIVWKVIDHRRVNEQNRIDIAVTQRSIGIAGTW